MKIILNVLLFCFMAFAASAQQPTSVFTVDGSKPKTMTIAEANALNGTANPTIIVNGKSIPYSQYAADVKAKQANEQKPVTPAAIAPAKYVVGTGSNVATQTPVQVVKTQNNQPVEVNMAQTGPLSSQTPVFAKAAAPAQVVIPAGKSASAIAVPVAAPKAAAVSGPSSTDNNMPAAAPAAKPVAKSVEKNSSGQ